MCSPARREANRKNARHSTGPVSAAGKQISSQNARKHSLYAQKPGVAQSEAAAFKAWLEEWCQRYDPASVEELNLVERAAHAAWKIHRCAEVEAANLDKRQRYAVAKHLRAQHDRADVLGAHLLLGHEERKHPYMRALEDHPKPDNPQPGATFRELVEFSQGAEWLIKSWRDMLAIVDDPVQTWDSSDRHRAIRLFGKRPEDAMVDPWLTRFFVTINMVYDDRTNLMQNFRTAGASPPYVSNHTHSLAHTPEEVAAGRVKLRTVIASEIARLEALKVEELDELYELDADCAVASALFDDSEAGKTLRRYETACERDLHRALMDLRKLQLGRVRGNEPIAEVVDGVGDGEMGVENNASSSLTLPHEWGGGDSRSEPGVEESPSTSGTLPTCGGGLGRGVSDPAAVEPVSENEPIAEVIAKSEIPSEHPAQSRRIVDAPVARPSWDNPAMRGAPRSNGTGRWVREEASN